MKLRKNLNLVNPGDLKIFLALGSFTAVLAGCSDDSDPNIVKAPATKPAATSPTVSPSPSAAPVTSSGNKNGTTILVPPVGNASKILVPATQSSTNPSTKPVEVKPFTAQEKANKSKTDFETALTNSLESFKSEVSKTSSVEELSRLYSKVPSPAGVNLVSMALLKKDVSLQETLDITERAAQNFRTRLTQAQNDLKSMNDSDIEVVNSPAYLSAKNILAIDTAFNREIQSLGQSLTAKTNEKNKVSYATKSSSYQKMDSEQLKAELRGLTDRVEAELLVEAWHSKGATYEEIIAYVKGLETADAPVRKAAEDKWNIQKNNRVFTAELNRVQSVSATRNHILTRFESDRVKENAEIQAKLDLAKENLRVANLSVNMKKADINGVRKYFMNEGNLSQAPKLGDLKLAVSSFRDKKVDEVAIDNFLKSEKTYIEGKLAQARQSSSPMTKEYEGYLASLDEVMKDVTPKADAIRKDQADKAAALAAANKKAAEVKARLAVEKARLAKEAQIKKSWDDFVAETNAIKTFPKILEALKYELDLKRVEYILSAMKTNFATDFSNPQQLLIFHNEIERCQGQQKNILGINGNLKSYARLTDRIKFFEAKKEAVNHEMNRIASQSDIDAFTQQVKSRSTSDGLAALADTVVLSDADEGDLVIAKQIMIQKFSLILDQLTSKSFEAAKNYYQNFDASDKSDLRKVPLMKSFQEVFGNLIKAESEKLARIKQIEEKNSKIAVSDESYNFSPKNPPTEGREDPNAAAVQYIDNPNKIGSIARGRRRSEIRLEALHQAFKDYQARLATDWAHALNPETQKAAVSYVGAQTAKIASRLWDKYLKDQIEKIFNEAQAGMHKATSGEVMNVYHTAMNRGFSSGEMRRILNLEIASIEDIMSKNAKTYGPQSKKEVDRLDDLREKKSVMEALLGRIQGLSDSDFIQ